MKGAIWKVMVEKKVFTQREIVEELLKNKYYSFLGKSFIKNKVRDFVRQQVLKGSLVQVEDGIFALIHFAKDWERYISYKECEICSSSFIPKNSQEKYCSDKCKNRADYLQKKEKKKQYLKTRKDLTRKASNKYKAKLQQMTSGNKRKGKWTIEELERLKEFIKEKGRLTKLELVKIANELDRSFKSVENKYYEIRRDLI